MSGSNESEAMTQSGKKPADVVAFDWEDPLDLDLDHELTEEETMVRDTAKGYAQRTLMRAGLCN